MTKLVINNCYGGFGLSPFGIEKYLERKGKQAYWYNRGENIKFIKTSNPNDGLTYVFTNDYGDSFNEYEKGDFFNDRHIPRDDPDLIYIIETYGSEKISGRFARLKVVEIPDDVDYEIDDYDGAESIEEVHRSWS